MNNNLYGDGEASGSSRTTSIKKKSSNTEQTPALLNSITNTNNTSNSKKKKRMRTSFKHQQLRIMKAHFQLNQNPDSKDLKELSERTGLQKRVLQVRKITLYS